VNFAVFEPSASMRTDRIDGKKALSLPGKKQRTPMRVNAQRAAFVYIAEICNLNLNLGHRYLPPF
jgi:hypothetical protein